MKRSLGFWSSRVPRSEGRREKRARHLSRREQLLQLLVELMPAVVANIIELYAAHPHVAAYDYSDKTIQIFTGDWTSPPKSIPLYPENMRVCDVCEFRGAFVVIAEKCFRGWTTIVADNQGNLQESMVSYRCGTLVQFQGKLYTFGRTHFAVFDDQAKCFLPHIKLPLGYTGVANACVFKGRLYLLLLGNGPSLRLSCFDIANSKCHDEGTLPELCFMQMCANDTTIFFYGLGAVESIDRYQYQTSSDLSLSGGVITTWNHANGFTPVESVGVGLRLITCDNDYIYFVNPLHIVVLYDIATKQLMPDPAPIEHAKRMSWFDVSSSKIF